MANQFTFRLETIRRLRRQKRDVQRRELAKAIDAVSTAQRQVQLLNQQLQGHVMKSRFAREVGVIDVVSMRTSEFHQGWLQRRILETGHALGACRHEVDGQREKLARANQQLRVLDKLRERQFERFQMEQNKREQASQDETALNMYQRSRMLITKREGV